MHTLRSHMMRLHLLLHHRIRLQRSKVCCAVYPPRGLVEVVEVLLILFLRMLHLRLLLLQLLLHNVMHCCLRRHLLQMNILCSASQLLMLKDEG